MISRTPDIKIDEENVFDSDTMDREPYVRYISEMLGAVRGPFVVALDAPWGTGKTTSIKMIEALLKNSGHKCLYFNAWKADHTSDPLIPLLAQLTKVSSTPTKQEKFIQGLKKGASKLPGIFLNTAVRVATVNAISGDEVLETVLSDGTGRLSDALMDSYFSEEAVIEDLRRQLQEGLDDLGADETKRLFFFVDELDRCRPNFAIAVLERIKHIFDIPNIVFVLSVDLSQLAESAKSIYGPGANTMGYLTRFFDLQIGLPRADARGFIESLFKDTSYYRGIDKNNVAAESLDEEVEIFIDCFNCLAEIYSLSLRDRQRCLTRFDVAASMGKSSIRPHPVFAAILVVYRMMEPGLYKRLQKREIEPLDLYEAIRKKPFYERFSQTYAFSLEKIFDFLIVADGQSTRAQAELDELTRRANSSSDLDALESSMAADRLRTLRLLSRGISSDLFYELVEKIDLSVVLN